MDKFPCKHCNGTGKDKSGFACIPCQGDGYYDWIENIVGKRKKLSEPGQNTFVGYQAGKAFNTGQYNTAIGYTAVYDLSKVKKYVKKLKGKKDV